jgi:TetR/AcrR family transcriptional regulator, repressor of fatR-cypB operon
MTTRAMSWRATLAVVPAIERAIAAGELKPYPAKAVAHMIMGNVHGYLMYALSTAACSPGPHAIWPPADEAASFITSVLLDGLVVRD